MALSITHQFVSAVADSGNSSLVQPSNWNASHSLSGILAGANGGTGVANTGFTLTLAGTSAIPILTNPSSATLQFGDVDAASPVAQTLKVQSVVGGTSNTAGVDWTFQGSLSTGSGAPGKIILSGGSNTNPGATTQRAAATVAVFHNPNAHPLMGLGGSSSSFGGIRGRGAVVEAVLADDSAYASFECNDLLATSGALSTNGGTVYLANDTAGAARIQFGSAGDIELARLSSTSLRVGAPDSAAPTALTLQAQSVVAGTSNTSGINLTLNGSLSTGSGTSGDIIFQTGGTGAGATSQNAATTAMTIKGATQQVVFSGTPRINTTPSAVTHTVTISSGADSVTNFGHVLQLNMNGTTYFIPCGTVQP